ncbi:hypothetical protein Rs2_50678 [Raphanus sativus]|nr:hypothetical protein Rs2_50678 [Raphanus sativus]
MRCTSLFPWLELSLTLSTPASTQNPSPQSSPRTVQDIIRRPNLETLARAALYLLPDEEQLNLLVIFIDEPDCPKRVSSNELDYEGLIRTGEPSSSLVARMFRIQNEQDPISLTTHRVPRANQKVWWLATVECI